MLIYLAVEVWVIHYVNLFGSQSLGWWVESSAGIRWTCWLCHVPCRLPVWYARTIGRKWPNHASLESGNLWWAWKV